ncbi:MAG: lipocalin family protein [Fibrobacter sp.]|nr:lipocalin family protein [Fibrobacter sp.]
MNFMCRQSVKVTLIGVLFPLIFIGISEARLKVEAVKDVDLNRYAGTWYEIARLPNKHEKGMVEATLTLNKGADGRYTLVTTGYKGSPGGKRTMVKGDVSIPDPKNTGDLKVKVLFFNVGYKIIDLDKENYRYALVTSDSDKFLWIFSRSPVLEEDAFQRMVESARQKGFAVDNLEMVRQEANRAFAER